MNHVVQCSADARQCVVLAVMDHVGGFDIPADIPSILHHESCDDYHDRCLDAFIPKSRALKQVFSAFRSRLQAAKETIVQCLGNARECTHEFLERLSGRPDSE